MSKPKFSVAVDFDGVIHQYNKAFVAHHVIPDPPVPGAIEWLHRTIQHFEVVIFSTRCKTWRGRRAMRAWFRQWVPSHLWYEYPGGRGLEDMKFAATKPPALVYLDDRAIRFDGENFPTPQQIHEARPWNKPKVARA